MIRKCLACIILAVICFGCSGKAQTNAPVTWRQDEDEIILYMDFSNEASAELINMLSGPVTFEQVSEFLVRNTDGKLPFFEGALTSAALTTRRIELKAEMDKKRSQDGLTLEVIGFQENPVKILKGALDYSQAPKLLADFDPYKSPEVVGRLIDLMNGHIFVVEAYGQYPEQ
jgi:hypothetical protein